MSLLAEVVEQNDRAYIISRTRRAMVITMPGLDARFRVPHNQSHQAVLGVARATAVDALQLKATTMIALTFCGIFSALGETPGPSASVR